MSETKGTEEFLDASDEFYRYLAAHIRSEVAKKTKDIEVLRELSEIIKINTASIKIQKEDTKSTKSPMEKAKARANGSQVPV